MPLRILHIIGGLGVGGANMMLCKLAASLNRAEFAGEVIALIDHLTLAPQLEALGLPVHTLGMPMGRPTPQGVAKLLRLVRAARPDLIQGWMYHGNIAGSFAASVLPGRTIPVVWNIRHSLHSLRHEKALSGLLIRLGAAWSNAPAAILYNSHVSAAQHERLGYSNRRRQVIPNGFDTDRLRPDPAARASVRAELNVPGDAPLIGLVARFHPHKDHRTFLEAAAIGTRQRPGSTYMLIGRDVTAANAELTDRIAALGLTAHVRLMGERDDIPRLTAAMDVAVCSSITEAFANVIGEAMACGVPCVSTDVGDAAAILANVGRVVPPRNPAALARAWLDLLDLPQAERDALTAAARNRVIGQYSLNAVADRYASLYRALGRRSG